MNIVYIQSHPVKDESKGNGSFIELVNREKWMPAITTKKGFPAEFWVAGNKMARTEWQYDTLPALTIRMFPAEPATGPDPLSAYQALCRSALMAWNLSRSTPVIATPASSSSLTETSPASSSSLTETTPVSSSSLPDTTPVSSSRPPETSPPSPSSPSEKTSLPSTPNQASPQAATGKETAHVEAAKKNGNSALYLQGSSFPGFPSGVPPTWKPVQAETGEETEELRADLFILIGTGPVAEELARRVLIPGKIPYALILCDTSRHKLLNHAAAVFYETDRQYHRLTRRGWRFWEKKLAEDQLIRIPASIDTRHFAPDRNAKADFEVIAMAPKNLPDKEPAIMKAYEPIFELSRRFKVGVIGNGSVPASFQRKYPEISWFGKVSYEDMPSLLSSGKLFFYSQGEEGFPQAIAEAAACGIPPVGFEDTLGEDVIPEMVGLRVSRKNYVRDIHRLINQPSRLRELSESARSWAENKWHHLSTERAVIRLVSRIKK